MTSEQAASALWVQKIQPWTESVGLPAMCTVKSSLSPCCGLRVDSTQARPLHCHRSATRSLVAAPLFSKAVGDTNAAAQDKALESLASFLAVTNEPMAARSDLSWRGFRLYTRVPGWHSA